MFESQPSQVNVPLTLVIIEQEQVVLDALEHLGDQDKKSLVIYEIKGIIPNAKLGL